VGKALCHACGADKDLALSRCAACGLVPEGDARALALICSTRVLEAEALEGARARIRKGERLAPSAALLARAHALLRGESPEARTLTRGEWLGLGVASLLLTPLLAWLAWFRWRTREGGAARQAWQVALYTSAASVGAWIAWKSR
jgi:hypothetical protein